MSEKKGPIDSILDELGTQRDEIELQIGLAKGEVKKHFYHHSAADIPPYLELADCSACYD